MPAFAPNLVPLPHRTCAAVSLRAERNRYAQLAPRRRSRQSWSCPTRSPTACQTPPASPKIYDLTLLAIPMPSGGDVIFPGGSHVFHLEQKTAERLLEHVAHLEPPQFAYLPISAWGDPGTVGTLAVIDELQITPDGSASLLCTGLSRFSIIHLDEKLENARVELLHDALPAPEDEEDIVELERKLVQTMTQIVQLSIKISSAEDEQRQIALTETLKRVEAFCGKCSEEESRMLLQHWILDLEPHLRRELLSFIVIDLLSVSFMERKSMMLSTNTGNRMGEALSGLQPFVKELAAKGAIVSALGKGASEGDEDVTSPSS